jgi:hypothetical protein
MFFHLIITIMKPILIASIIVSVFFFNADLFAQTLAKTMSYQGSLVDGSGKPVADGSYQLTFTIYDGTGTSVWTESQSVKTVRGIYSATLGETTGLPSPFPINSEMEVKINGTALTPRTKLAGVPYAMDLARSFVAGVSANGNIVTQSGDTVGLIGGSNVVLAADPKLHTITISAGGNPSSITGVQSGKYLTGGGTSGVVTISLAIPLSIHESEASDLFSVGNDGAGRAIVGSAHGTGGAGHFEVITPGNTSVSLHSVTAGVGQAGLFEATNSGNAGPVLQVLNSGTGPTLDAQSKGSMGIAGNFLISNQTNTDDAVYSLTQGMGSAGSFLIKNPNNSTHAVFANTNGTGAAVYGLNDGMGYSGEFSISSADNTSAALHAVTKSSNGSAALIEIINGNDGQDALMTRTDGKGNAASFSTSTSDKTVLNHAITASSSGRGATLHAENDGSTGPAAEFQNYSGGGNDSASTVIITSNGEPGNGLKVSKTGDQGSAGYFTNSKQTNTSDALYAETAGAGNAIHGYGGTKGTSGQFDNSPGNPKTVLNIVDSGTGIAGSFEIDNKQNSQPAVCGHTKGTGNAGYFYKDTTTDQNYYPSLYAKTDAATGLAGYFVVSNSVNPSAGIQVSTNGTGGAAIFEATNAASAAPGVILTNAGTGLALLINGNNTSGNIPVIQVNAKDNQHSAATFGGGVNVSGNLTVSGSYGAINANTVNATSISCNSISAAIKNFKIDHPLDPANKYLVYASIESPEMKNIYDGMVQLDANGEAWVTLPDYFEALNQDFRYQLTSVGAPGPNLYIAAEIQGNRFKIAGGQKGAKVSWMVTGIRHDAYAISHPLVPEQQKEIENRGKLLYPEAR